MTRPSETLWDIEPHTQAKHEILRRYLGAWFAIRGPRNQRIVYIDGFCGPGRYNGGEMGSPLIALREAQKQPLLVNAEVKFLFIDENANRISHLRDELAQLNLPNNFEADCVVNEFESSLTVILDSLQKSGSRLAPTFAFIDPFGFKGAPFELVKRLLGNPGTEVFITIMTNSINRFVDIPNAADREHIRKLLGASDAEIGQVIGSVGRIPAFRQLYQKKLHEYATYVRFFSMHGQRDNVIYDLFFASNHRLGHKKMKEAFWKVDCQSGFKFSDNTDPNQLVLIGMNDYSELARDLEKHFAGLTRSAQDIITYVEDETAYTCSYAKKALIQLEDQNKISVEPMKCDEARRKAHTFSDGVIVHFK